MTYTSEPTIPLDYLRKLYGLDTVLNFTLGFCSEFLETEEKPYFKNPSDGVNKKLIDTEKIRIVLFFLLNVVSDIPNLSDFINERPKNVFFKRNGTNFVPMTNV